MIFIYNEKLIFLGQVKRKRPQGRNKFAEDGKSIVHEGIRKHFVLETTICNVEID